MILNPFQKAILKDYADGDFADLIHEGHIENLHDLGDTLLSFMLIELSNSEDCKSAAEASERLGIAHKQIEVAMLALDALNQEIAQRSLDIVA